MNPHSDWLSGREAEGGEGGRKGGRQWKKGTKIGKY